MNSAEYKRFLIIGTAFLSLGLVVLAASSGIFLAVRFLPSTTAATELSFSHISLSASAIEARSAVVYDLQSGNVLYQKNAYEPLPLASLTKMMATELVLSQKEPATPVEITKTDLLPEGDCGLVPGSTVLLSDLIRIALVASCNDAMQSAASTLGSDPAQKMNGAAEALGLVRTHFLNPTGLDVDTTTPGAVGSAYDVARLALRLYQDHPDFFELTTHGDTDTPGNKTIKATTLPLQSIPGFVAAKTGYTDLAGGNLVALFDLEPGHTVIIAVLGSSRDGRFSDVIQLVDAARESL